MVTGFTWVCDTPRFTWLPDVLGYDKAWPARDVTVICLVGMGIERNSESVKTVSPNGSTLLVVLQVGFA